MKLEGETAIVTGAGRGIGREIARTQAAEGAKVALLARTAAQIGAVADEIVAAGGTARAWPVDVTDLAAVERVVAEVENDLGPVGLVTNNAAMFAAIGPIWEVDPAAWWRDVEVNVRGTFHVCRAVLPAMMARKRGRVINMAGGGSADSFPMGSGYGTSKAGVLRFTECVSDSVAGTGVLVFAMDPGLVRTAMTEYQLTSEAGRTWLPDIEQLFENRINVPPTFAARLSVEIGSGRFDKLAGRMLMAARGDVDLTGDDIDAIVAEDLRSLRVNGVPAEKPRSD